MKNELDWELKYAHAERARKRRRRERYIQLKRVPPMIQHTRIIRLASPFELRIFIQPDGSVLGLIYYAVWVGKSRPQAHSLWGMAKVTVRKG